jgi:hypothetical protein
MDSIWTSTFIPKTKQEQQREKLVEVLFKFLHQNPKVSDLLMSDEEQSSDDLAQQTDEISPTPIVCCTAEAEAQEDYVEKLYELLSEHGLEEATWEFHVRSDQREFQQVFIAAVDLQHELHFRRPPGAKMVGSYIAQDLGEAQQVPIVFNTGCSMLITPFKLDFIGPIEETNVKELNAVKDAVPIEGIGLGEWTIEDWNHQVVVGQLRPQAYYVPESTIRLCSPQEYFEENKKGYMYCEFNHTKLDFHLADGQVLQFGFCAETNIPLMRLFDSPAHLGPGNETFLV